MSSFFLNETSACEMTMMLLFYLLMRPPMTGKVIKNYCFVFHSTNGIKALNSEQLHKVLDFFLHLCRVVFLGNTC
jgi:hypothetical protein